jgi:hypothetical protein
MAMLEEPKHVARERKVADRLAEKWKCSCEQMWQYCPYDLCLRRGSKVFGIAEVRTLTRTYEQYPSFFIDLDKWFTLWHNETALRMMSFYVVAFTNGVWWVRIGDLPVKAFEVEFIGREDRPDVVNDQRATLKVSTRWLRRLCDADGIFED